jgi:hypothetical protein
MRGWLLAVLLVAPAAGAMTLTARVAVPRGTAMPDVVEARAGDADVRCPVINATVRCVLPEGTSEVRLCAEGFAPVYLWNLDAAGIAEVRFHRGVVVTGYARPSAGNAGADGIDVELRPAVLAWSPDDKKRVTAATRRTKTNARGFFQFDGVEAGEYEVIAKKDRWSPAEYRVHVSGTTNEAVVGKELVLDTLGRVEVSLQPPVDAQQRPWHVALERFVSGEVQTVARSVASITGQWSHEGLESGSYSVSISDADGSRLASDGRWVAGETAYIPFTIDQVAVRGTLTLDDAPVNARLRFLDRFGKRVDMESDAEGRFSGVLPKQGLWSVDIRRGDTRSILWLDGVEVRRSDATGYADLSLELPAGRVHGSVTTEGGEAVGANVKIWSGRSMVASMSTAADGLFDFTGIPPGDVEIAASGKGTHSGMVAHKVGGLEDDPIRIVVGKTATARARVVTATGRPLAGVLVSWVLTRMIQDDLTGPNGEVRIPLPPSMKGIDVAISALGYPLKMATVPATDEVIEIRMPAAAGTLAISFDTRTTSYPRIGRGGFLLPLSVFFSGPTAYEARPVRTFAEGFTVLLEPGEYTVCNVPATQCETRVVQPGAREVIDARAWSK